MTKKNLSSRNKTAERFQKLSNIKTIKVIYPFLKKVFFQNKYSISLISVLSSINAFLATGILIIVYQIINEILNIPNESSVLVRIEKLYEYFKIDIDYKILLAIFLSIFFSILVINILISSNLITKFILDYKKNIIKKTLKINLQYFTSKNAGDIGYVYQACVNRCSNYPTQLSKLIYNVFLFLTLNLILFQFSSILFLNLLIVIFIVMLVYLFLNKFSVYFNQKYIELFSVTNSKIYELVDSIKLISQIKNKKSYEEKVFFDIQKTVNFVRKYYIFTNFINQFFNYVFVVLILLLIFYANFYQIEKISILVSFGFTSLLLAKVIQSLLANFTSLLNISINFNEIQRILKIKEINKNTKYNKIQVDSINIKNAFFSYEDEKNLTVNDLNVSFFRGKSYLIYGQSGSGKSTLFNLIYNFVQLRKGKILINNKYNISEFTRNISYVTQDHFFLNDTIFENLKLFKNDLNTDEAKKILDFVDLKLNLNKLAGNQGKKLSGGQKAKLTLARCLLSNPQILLIDESLSSIDQKSRNFIIKNLNKLKKNMIQIFISHEIYYGSNFSKVFKMKDGKLISR